jgi:hypothetical protein
MCSRVSTVTPGKIADKFVVNRFLGKIVLSKGSTTYTVSVVAEGWDGGDQGLVQRAEKVVSVRECVGESS